MLFQREKRMLIDLAWKHGLDDPRIIKQSHIAHRLEKELRRRYGLEKRQAPDAGAEKAHSQVQA